MEIQEVQKYPSPVIELNVFSAKKSPSPTNFFVSNPQQSNSSELLCGAMELTNSQLTSSLGRLSFSGFNNNNFMANESSSFFQDPCCDEPKPSVATLDERLVDLSQVLKTEIDFDANEIKERLAKNWRRTTACVDHVIRKLAKRSVLERYSADREILCAYMTRASCKSQCAFRKHHPHLKIDVLALPKQERKRRPISYYISQFCEVIETACSKEEVQKELELRWDFSRKDTQATICRVKKNLIIQGLNEVVARYERLAKAHQISALQTNSQSENYNSIEITDELVQALLSIPKNPNIADRY